MNIFIAQTPYHILLSCLKCSKGDSLLYIGFQINNTILEQMIKTKFGSSGIKYTYPLTYYKNNIAALVAFRRLIKNDIDCYNKEMIETVYVFNDVDPIVQRILHNLTFKNAVVIEEGIGLYRDVRKQNAIVFSKFGRMLFGFNFENIKRIGTSKNINTIQCNNPERLNYDQKAKNIIRINKVDFSIIATELNIRQHKSRYWFIGQPLVEDGVLSISEYIKIIRN